MFKISQTATFWWPVEVKLPDGPGKYLKQTFECEFRRLSQSRLTEIQDAIIRREVSDRQFAIEIVAGWKGIQDADGNEMPFTDTNRDMVFDIALVQGAVINAYTDAMQGAARRKN